MTCWQNDDSKNEVVVMGMIHSGHRESGPYDLEHLKSLIRKIKPDYVLTEIPPDRLEAAAKQFRKSGKITEPRVRVFPEYTDALFPLTREIDFEVIPCAAWTTEMNDSRRATLAKLKETHSEQYKEMGAAQAAASSRIASLGSEHDPVIIHTDQYDRLVKEGMGPYNRHFNDLIGEGGWENINAAHYALIAGALDKHTGKGKRFLVTFGSWHKYYIKEQLAKRTDVRVIPMSDFLTSDYPAPEAWSQFRLNSNHTCSYGLTEIQQPEQAWKFSTGDVIESSPAVVGDTVYIGGHAKRVHAIDRVTGKLKWKFDVGGWVRASPSVVDGQVFFGSDDNKFYALDAATGKKEWDFQLGEGGEQSSPAIIDGIVYFGGFDKNVYALEAKTGKQIWKFDAGASMLSSPAVTKDSVYIATYDGKCFAINRETGQQRWVFHESEQPIFASPVVHDGIVYFGSYDQHVYALHAHDGAFKWKFKTTGQIFSSAAVTAESIYVGSSDGNLYALNRNDGQKRWAHLVGKDVKVWTSPAAIQGWLYFGSHAGDVVAVREKK